MHERLHWKTTVQINQVFAKNKALVYRINGLGREDKNRLIITAEIEEKRVYGINEV